ncbi:hypothetical protein NC651_024073 [Populus alba x Populus x berolinensis]|nr:hypothetical protein NC651_024073 [Populus alba x Populus x berolinensis]
MKDSFLPKLPSLLFLYYLEVNRSGTFRESYDYNFPGKSNIDIIYFFLLKKEEFGNQLMGNLKYR